MVQISVIVPVFNGAKTLRLCLESLLSQDYPADAYEIIVVNNNSTDGSAALAAQFARVRLLHERRQGSYAARNHAVARASGAILAFTDADCVAGKQWLCNISREMSEATTEIVLGNCQPGSQTVWLDLWADYEHFKHEFVFGGNARELYFGYTSNMSVRRASFERHGPFLERRRGSDTIFVRKVVNAVGCSSVVYRPDVRVCHLELDSVAALYRKLYIYGRSSRLYGRVARCRSLSWSQRANIYRRTVRELGYSRGRALDLLVLLVAGAVFWTLGTWSAPLMPREQAAILRLLSARSLH